MSNFGDKVDLPFTADDPKKYWSLRGLWPARWLAWGGSKPEHTVCAYRRRFRLEEARHIRLFVSGDNKYRLYLDGRLLGFGPELGDNNNFYYDVYELDLEPGEHTFAGIVCDFQDQAAYCHMSLHGGFLVAVAEPESLGEVLNTGGAAWEVKAVDALEWLATPVLYPHVGFHAARWPEGITAGRGQGWCAATPLEMAAYAEIRNEFPPERLMRAARLPRRLYRAEAMVEALHIATTLCGAVVADPARGHEEAAWLDLFNGRKPVRVPARSALRIVGKLDDYHCVYPVFRTRGGAGARITLSWAEALYLRAAGDEVKGRRDQWEGKFFRRNYEVGDRFYPFAGEGEFFTPWWRAGRYFEFMVETGDEALEITEFHLFDTRYPLESEVALHTDDERLNAILPLCYRTVQMCTHDTFMDCPYYEQLMYIGDSRLEALVVLASTRDDEMVRKMLRLFASSQLNSGFLYSRYPSRVCQIIPTFSLIWIAALHDYAQMRSNRDLVLDLLGCAKKIVAAFERKINADGLIEFAQGWNFMDWTPRWNTTRLNFGAPPGAEYGVSPVLNFLYVYALRHLAELCEYAGEAEVGAYYLRRGREVTGRLIAHYYRPERGLFVETADGGSCCEHSQCLGLLAGFLPPEIAQSVREKLYTEPDLDPTSISFSHYYFECCRQSRRMDAFFARMQLWFDCKDLGLATLMERPEPSRSDCHGWSGHPYFHTAATLGGIRPGAFEFRRVRIEPQLGTLSQLHAEMIHPSGKIVADYRVEENRVECRIVSPVPGELLWQGRLHPLAPGETRLSLERGFSALASR